MRFKQEIYKDNRDTCQKLIINRERHTDVQESLNTLLIKYRVRTENLGRTKLKIFRLTVRLKRCVIRRWDRNFVTFNNMYGFKTPEATNKVYRRL